MISSLCPSTSSSDHDRRIEFCACSSPLTATPPALDALPGANSSFRSRNTSVASIVEGMFSSPPRPGDIRSRRAAGRRPHRSRPGSHRETRDRRARGQGRSPGWNVPPHFSTYSGSGPVVASSGDRPGELLRVEAVGIVDEALRSESVTTRAPSSTSFSAVCCATLPEPETRQTFARISSPRVASISRAK